MRCLQAVLVGASLALAGCAARASVEVGPQVAVVESSARVPQSNHVWVCHRGRWQEVGSPAADAHRRHGDRISGTAHTEHAGC